VRHVIHVDHNTGHPDRNWLMVGVGVGVVGVVDVGVGVLNVLVVAVDGGRHGR